MKLKLKFKFSVVISSVVIVASVLLAVISYSKSKQSLETAVKETITTVTNNAATQIYRDNTKIFHILSGLASTEILRNPELSFEDKQVQLDEVPPLDDDYLSCYFYDKKGFYFDNKKGVVDGSSNIAYKNSIRGYPFLTSPAKDKNSNDITFVVSMPVFSEFNEKEVIGVIILTVDGTRFCRLCESLPFGINNSHPFLIDADSGFVVANADVEVVTSGYNIVESSTGAMKEAVEDAVAKNEAYRIIYDQDSKRKLIVSYRPIGPKSPWVVFCIAPAAEYFGQIDKMLITLIIQLIVTAIVTVIVCICLINFIVKPLKLLGSSINDISEGNADLTKRINVKSKDEVGDVVNGFNKFSEKLQSIITEIKDSKENLNVAGEDMSCSASDTSQAISEIIENINNVKNQINSQTSNVNQTVNAVSEIAENIESLEEMIESQSDQVHEASAAVEQMIGNINSVNSSVDKMAESFTELRLNANAGNELQKNVNEKINLIEGQSKMLQEANTVIASIAGQTNLLAMNAAIEAAHAGESGKGFSVVADEIRKLSETSRKQSKTIGDQLKSIKDSISGVVDASSKSSAAFVAVTNKIQDTDHLVSQIKSAMEEQTIGSKQISEALYAMNDGALKVRTASSEMAEGNKAILQEVEELKISSEKIVESMNDMSNSATKINETGVSLSGISEKVNQSINEIGSQIDQFKV
ncbi:MAG: methyl-accepting chemotaxis protein [Treponema sp.]|uniref:methyl-accepting chemotaxis protein n=1 Tax=Treponema sp. TaxID=166 RepID=UPI00298E4E12|nr:methyl-accepting chemotaxis protein [Treponema sp.]MCQ2601406.1 methyl-accepting chemotaxis protein [Treponema sp.]